MTRFHPDSTAVARFKTRDIMDHFSITRQSVAYWRRAGVPKQCRKPLVLFGKAKGIDLDDFVKRHGAEV